MVVLSIILTLILSIIVAKGVWMRVANRNIGDFATEKEDILMRRDYLIDKIITNPEDLIAAMPEVVAIPRGMGSILCIYAISCPYEYCTYIPGNSRRCY